MPAKGLGDQMQSWRERLQAKVQSSLTLRALPESYPRPRKEEKEGKKNSTGTCPSPPCSRVCGTLLQHPMVSSSTADCARFLLPLQKVSLWGEKQGAE